KQAPHPPPPAPNPTQAEGRGEGQRACFFLPSLWGGAGTPTEGRKDGGKIGGKESKRAEQAPPLQVRGTSHASPPTPHSLFPTPLATHATIGATHIARTKARHASCLDRLCPAAPSPAISRSPTSG